jgi:hypothetical protein
MELSRRFGVDNLVRQSGSNHPAVRHQGPMVSQSHELGARRVDRRVADGPVAPMTIATQIRRLGRRLFDIPAL